MVNIVRSLQLSREVETGNRPLSTVRALNVDRGGLVSRNLSLSRVTFNTRDLYPYQIAGVNWLSARRRAILADAPGLGKTAQLLRASVNDPIVVICPASLEGVWRAQTARWRPDLDVMTGNGRTPAYGRLDIYSYDYRGSLPSVAGCTVLIDELHYLRHAEIVRSTKWAYLAQASTSATRIYGATGTPIVGYQDEFAVVLAAIGLDRPEVLRRVESDVDIQLPTRVYDEIPATIGHDLYTVLSILDERWSLLDTNKVPPLPMFSTARAQLARAKVETALAWIARHEDERLIVYSNYLDPLRAIVSARRDWALVTGEQTIDERDAIIAAFERGSYRGLACTIGAVGVGVTIVSPRRMLFVDRAWNPGENEQVEKRVCRIGQKASRVFISDIIADHPVERRLYDILAKKRVDAELVYEVCST